MVYRASAGGGSGSGGDVVGPASSTDNAIARFDGATGKLLQNSGVTIADAGGVTLTAGTNSTVSINVGAIATGFYQDSNFPSNAVCWASGGIVSGALHEAKLWMCSNGFYGWGSQVNTFNGASYDTAIKRVAAGVTGTTIGESTTLGYHQWAGEARVTADVSFVSTATLANVTGLSASVTAGRTYNFNVVLYTTANVAGGIKAAVNATAAATFVRYEGYSMHVNTILGQTRATAVATAVGATTTAIAATVFICGTITPSATGTFTVQAAQNATTASATVILAGSYMQVYDTP